MSRSRLRVKAKVKAKVKAMVKSKVKARVKRRFYYSLICGVRDGEPARSQVNTKQVFSPCFVIELIFFPHINPPSCAIGLNKV